MLKATNQNQLIDLTQISKSELEVLYHHRGTYHCPDCKEPVMLKCGAKKRPHFAHRFSCTAIASDNESEEHLLAKQLLKDWVIAQGAKDVTCEKRFHNIHRVADLYFVYGGARYVLEIQKSHLSEATFKSRTIDYESQGIQVIWIFIGSLNQRNQTYFLNRQMRLNREALLIHFNLENQQVTLIRSRIWLNPKEVRAQGERISLSNLSISTLVEKRWSPAFITRQDWIEIKRQFRTSKWFYYAKTDRKLTRLCVNHHFNLSLMPAEIGWPILNNYGFIKPLFIWQAYVLIGVVMGHSIGEVLTVSQIARTLTKQYKVTVNEQAICELKQYLQFLVNQRILIQSYGYYEIIRHPIYFKTLEEALQADDQVSSTFTFKD